MKNFLNSWFKRSSSESLQNELPMGAQAPSTERDSYAKEEFSPEFSIKSLGGDRNAMALDLIQEPGVEYGGSREGEVPRKKMDENLYRALSG